MPFFIDRRRNPKDKSLGNRQRFLRRARASIKEVVNKKLKDRSIGDLDSGETISIPSKDIDEPRLRHSRTGGRRSGVFKGNKEYLTGDRLPKPQGGEGGGGKQGSDSGEGEDAFRFALTREEFLDLFFEDLELPDLVKTSLKDVTVTKPHRAGLSSVGTPTNLNVQRTMRNSFSRRLALKRPRKEEIAELQREIMELERRESLEPEQRQRLKALHEELEELLKRQRSVPYIDPHDLRFNYFEQKPQPITQAVMFCLMDVSGSMGEREKDLAKRFFMLLHLFLDRCYERTEVIFIRHTHEAKEVDEETFFYSRESGGTVISTALLEMQKIMADRYPTSQWNIYAAQASDGENYAGDSEKCIKLLSEALMPYCQYYAYVEILDERESALFQDEARGTELWRSYLKVRDAWPNFAMKRISRPGDIFPVFRELFASTREVK
ncbi:YeaH/YhbH family protein [Pelagibius marinus]|uniref:YeaH/YhbH family protein n=1 Tax=Pelagibius marinus TaxID=2762760 RepID=UPI0018732EC1|nr:YeaH/YhbH family protein [Pelagibius marinus]